MDIDTVEKKHSLQNGCCHLLFLIRKDLNERHPGYRAYLESSNLHESIKVDRNAVPTCLDVLRHTGFIANYEFSKRPRMLSSVPDLCIYVPEDFFERCRKFDSRQDTPFHKVILDEDSMTLKDLVSGSEIMTFPSSSKRFTLASFFFIVNDENRGEWLNWDDIAHNYHQSDNYDSTKTKRMVYDAVMAINEAAGNILGFHVIELDGQNRYKVVM
ncbi:hypothetical protein COV05_00110 [Candidatus Uhrbacteria bacterium CG10_big_fil_rev_8_21_14_0_10_48_16]|uniref:Uncharacterized protein n=1 Tax=Candidatus Uhrbacteria bacterium CG10_big_fil_rev_8_21_14_0_10_48_16 TaxID=1975038 RepID=A0A2M8LII3_9BACT|nr:MAG: hypothetical protein COV05_00110 [Candidatus Uhrbacteria bacterium CG10_big_fil_rev_8_21_14_0_10_48_16]